MVWTDFWQLFCCLSYRPQIFLISTCMELWIFSLEYAKMIVIGCFIQKQINKKTVNICSPVHMRFFFFMIMGKILFFLFLFNASNTKWNLLSPWVERKENSLDTSTYNFLANESMNCVYFSDSSPLPLASVSTYTAFFCRNFLVSLPSNLLCFAISTYCWTRKNFHSPKLAWARMWLELPTCSANWHVAKSISSSANYIC